MTSTTTKRRRPSENARVAAAASSPGGSDPRLHLLNGAAENPRGQYVLYWCRAYRRAHDNLALEHAIARANALGLPLVAYEALDPRYPYASDRLHAFVLQGACEMHEAMAARGVTYGFYLPRTRHEAAKSRALARLAERARLVVTDWYPPVAPSGIFARTSATAAALPCRAEAYDDASVVPMALLQKPEIAARTIRPKVRALLDAGIARADESAVRAGTVREMAWPFEPEALTRDRIPSLLADCEVDHTVAPVASTTGGRAEALARIARFQSGGLRAYADARNDMAQRVGSQLSAYLHFGHLSARALARAIADTKGHDASRDAFIEELAVRRSLAFNHAMTHPSPATYDAVPAWARATLAAHARDPRPADHTLREWETARTIDPLWNAAQTELLREGTIHPYARMLWGKVGITLTAKPEDAFAWLVFLNDRYALDGRDPNTYTNIAWCFGLHDHPYPERAIYGMVRSMTSAAAARKWDTEAYVARVYRASA